MNRNRYPKVNYARNRRRFQWAQGAEIGGRAIALERGEEAYREARTDREALDAFRNDPTMRRD